MLKRLIVLMLIVVGTVSAASTAASAEAPPEEEAGSTPANPYTSPSGLAVRSSNGYWLTVNSARGHRVEVEASGPDGSVTYAARGSVTDTGIHANLGKYGRIDMRWVPNGRVRRVRLKCRVRGVLNHFYDAGAYVGTLRFRGGGGFTSVTAHRVAWSRSWYSAARACGYSVSTAEPGAGIVIEAGKRGHISTPVHLFVYKPHQGAKVEYSARSEGKTGRIKITRHAFADGGTHSLTAAGEYPSVTATISPPAPFYGAATFEPSGPEKGTLTGTVGVEFPDHTKVALAGKDFEADLRLESINIIPG
ncbi:MAG: hypothetical protein QM729_09550 [Solirubrobacterales bacterium]